MTVRSPQSKARSSYSSWSADGPTAPSLTERGLLVRTTRCVVRFRSVVVAFWLAALLAGAFASLHLRPLLANGFGVPHSDSQIAADTLAHHFGDRSDGEYLVVFAGDRPVGSAARGQVQAALERAVRTVPSARAGPVEVASRRLLYAAVDSRLDFAQAKQESAQLARALRTRPASAPTSAARRRFNASSTPSSRAICIAANSRSPCPQRSSCCCSSSESRRS